jgi:hypothetical protein
MEGVQNSLFVNFSKLVNRIILSLIDGRRYGKKRE